jgi:hypothetical protein
MRRTSSMVWGFLWAEWLDRTTSSDSTDSMCAAEYLTTPSSPRSTSPSPSTAMMELTLSRVDERLVEMQSG